MAAYIKVNIPLTEKEYISGNGEGVWVLVDDKTKYAHDSDAVGPGYHGILANDSLYYPGLCVGDMIEFEMRGYNRPVADYYRFLKDRTHLTEAGKEMLIATISRKQTELQEEDEEYDEEDYDG